MKKYLAWLIALAGIPAEAAILTAWYLIVSKILEPLFPKLPWLANTLLDYTAVIPLTGTFLLISTSTWFVEQSNKLSFSKKGTRFAVVGAVTLGIICYITVLIFRHKFPESTDFMLIFNILYAMGIYAYRLIRGVYMLQKRLDKTPTPDPIQKITEERIVRPTVPAEVIPVRKFHIAVCFTPEVPETEQKMIVQASKELTSVFSMCNVMILNSISIGSLSWGEDGYFSPKQMVKGTEIGEQYDAVRVLANMRKARKHLTDNDALVLFVEKDLYHPDSKAKWCFGSASDVGNVTVQSVYRYRDLTDEEKLRCIRRTLRHELGHIFKLCKSPGRANTLRNAGMHCTNHNCSMNKTKNTSDLVLHSKLEAYEKNFFCP